MEARITGYVKWFDETKGYGFIVRDDNKEEIFFHKKDVIETNGFRIIKHQKFAFYIGMNQKGKVAVELQMINEEINEETNGSGTQESI